MKRFLFTLTLLACSTVLFSQTLTKGSSTLSFGLGIGSTLKPEGAKTSLPPIEAQFQFFISDELSIGPFLAISSIKGSTDGYGNNDLAKAYNDQYNNGSSSTSINAFGGIVNYHFYGDETLTAYGGARLGYAKNKLSEPQNFVIGAHIGGNYFLSKNLALNAELGYGVAILKVGALLKL